MATGRRAFPGATPAMISASLLKETPVPVSELNPACPRELDKIIRKALEKDRGLRYQRAADIREDLERLKADAESDTATGPALNPLLSRESHAVTKPRLHIPSWTVILGLLVCLLSAGFLLWIRARRAVIPIHTEYTQLTFLADAATSPHFLRMVACLHSFVAGTHLLDQERST